MKMVTTKNGVVYLFENNKTTRFIIIIFFVRGKG